METAQLLFGLAAAGLLVLGFGLGRRRPGGWQGPSRRLEEYDFYPFVADEYGHIQFRADRFLQAVDHFMRERNPLAAGELIVIGEQNFVRDTFSSADLTRYKHFFERYDGDSIISDNAAFLENYRRIVRLVGQSFPHTGIEILLHDLVNPSRSVIEIEGGEVTGRAVGAGTTNLVLDLKTRRSQGQDKLNYELTIGARRFKCTTIPIFRSEYGLVGAICINIDARFMREHVMVDQARLEAFFDNLLTVEMRLDENILSPAEFRAAMSGKRHFLDEAIRASAPGAPGHRLAAIVFSDIVDFTSLMEVDEHRALATVQANTKLHLATAARHGGTVLKEMGDGLLLRFDSVARAVDAAREIQAQVEADGSYRLRVGIHVGEVAEVGGDVLGDGVNLASRIQAEAHPGTIAVSEVVAANVRNQPGIVVTPLGDRYLKNVTDPIRLFTVEV
jgi:class 3 adenylate cyclase